MTGLFKAEGLPDQAFGPANIVVSMTSRPRDPNNFHFPNDGSEPSLYNFVAEIPLPVKAKFI